jgi:hypothetical protein
MKIAMYDLEGHLLEVFEGKNVSQIASALKLTQASLYQCISGQILSVKNRQFKEVFQDRPLHKIGDVSNCTHGNKHTPIIKSYKGKYISTYRNAHAASQITKVNESCIHNCLKGERASAGGFEWKYAN